jgi:hypothetical protein
MKKFVDADWLGRRAITFVIIYMTKLLQSHRLRGVQLFH